MRRPFVNLLARGVALATLVYSPTVHAICTHDLDGDGYGSPVGGPSCPAIPDCDEGRPLVNPGVFEDIGTSADDNCNQRSGILPLWMEARFAPFAWVDVGTVTRAAGNTYFDTVKVGTPTGGSASTTRTLAGVPLNVSVAVAAKVSGNIGTGTPCAIRLGTTAPGGGGAVTWVSQSLPSGTGLQVLSFQGLIPVSRSLKQVQIACYGQRSLSVDWLQVQDNLEEFGPVEEAVVTWRDVRNPGADASISVVVDDDDGKIWLGTDTSGVALYDADGWHPQNGRGETSLMMGGTLGASDILPLSGSDEVYVLSGDVGGSGPIGGLWYSTDDGEHWEQIGSSLQQWPPTTSPPATPDYSDDVAAYSLESNCPGSHFGREWHLGGGRHLVGHSTPAVTMEPIYIGNGDWDNLGVSVFDPAAGKVCPLANIGDALPADRVGALLRVDALPDNTPTLVVGYRAQVNAGAALYVCELPPGGVDCSGTKEADCQVVDVDPFNAVPQWDLSGIDVRDLEEDTWSSGEGDLTYWTGVLVADGGARPVDLDSDGIGDSACSFDDSHLLEVFISDFGAGLTVDVEPLLADSLDMPQLLSGADQLTGISIDPFSQYVYGNVPRTHGSIYEVDRIYRVPAADLLDASSSPLWEAVNSGESPAPAYAVEDFYEALRAGYDLDLSGSWLEATVNGRAAPFPARMAPGKTWDTAWIWHEAAAGPAVFAVVSSALNVWAVSGLDQPWTDTEGDVDGVMQPELDVDFVFWPTISELETTFQGWPVAAVAVSADGHIWSGAGDQALSHFDGTEVFDPAHPNGSEVDCLWHGWHASSTSVTAVAALEPDESATVVRPGCEMPSPPPSVVWATLSEPAGDGNPHNIGVIRSLDNGTTWNYAGAGWEGMTVNTSESDMTLSDYGARQCVDRDLGHQALQFESRYDASTIRPPSHAFSTGDPTLSEEMQGTELPSLGSPTNIRALNEESAVLLFLPTQDGDDNPVTEGGLYLTIDGGSTWHPVEFDGGAGDCDERTTYAAGSFELIHPGSDSYWDPDTGTATYDLLYAVSAQELEASATASACSLARVVITMGPSDSDLAPATWSWYTYPNTKSTDYADVGYCGVSPYSLEGATPSLTGNEAVVYGRYLRYGNGTATGTLRQAYGGACMFDLDDADLTGQFAMVVDPFDYVQSIYAVASHPQVADLWAILPTMAGDDYEFCGDHRGGWEASLVPATAQLECEYPWPLLVQGTAAGFTISPTAGPLGIALTTPKVSYPVGRVSSAAWSELAIPDDSADCVGSYLVVGTQSQGTWRGEFTW